MRKIINKNRARLVFPKYDFVIESDEIKDVTEEQYKGIIRNSSIEEVLYKNLEKETDKRNKTINKKGRKNKKININY